MGQGKRRLLHESVFDEERAMDDYLYISHGLPSQLDWATALALLRNMALYAKAKASMDGVHRLGK